MKDFHPFTVRSLIDSVDELFTEARVLRKRSKQGFLEKLLSALCDIHRQGPLVLLPSHNTIWNALSARRMSWPGPVLTYVQAPPDAQGPYTLGVTLLDGFHALESIMLSGAKISFSKDALFLQHNYHTASHRPIELQSYTTPLLGKVLMQYHGWSPAFEKWSGVKLSPDTVYSITVYAADPVLGCYIPQERTSSSRIGVLCAISDSSQRQHLAVRPPTGQVFCLSTLLSETPTLSHYDLTEIELPPIVSKETPTMSVKFPNTPQVVMHTYPPGSEVQENSALLVATMRKALETPYAQARLTTLLTAKPSPSPHDALLEAFYEGLQQDLRPTVAQRHLVQDTTDWSFDLLTYTHTLLLQHLGLIVSVDVRQQTVLVVDLTDNQIDVSWVPYVQKAVRDVLEAMLQEEADVEPLLVTRQVLVDEITLYSITEAAKPARDFFNAFIATLEQEWEGIEQFYLEHATRVEDGTMGYVMEHQEDRSDTSVRTAWKAAYPTLAHLAVRIGEKHYPLDAPTLNSFTQEVRDIVLASIKERVGIRVIDNQCEQ